LAKKQLTGHVSVLEGTEDLQLGAFLSH